MHCISLPVIHHGFCRCQQLPELLIEVLYDEGLVLEPLISLLHLSGVGIHLVPQLSYRPQHVLTRERRGLVRLRELRIQLQEFPEL